MELSKVNECIEDMNVGAGAEPTDLSDAPKEIKEKIINNAELLDKFVASASAITDRDPEKGSKLKALAASVLLKYTEKLK